MSDVTSKSYTVIGERGEWVGQVVLTSDGMFASVTDWGNLSYAWRAYGKDKDFRAFLCGLNVGYFGGKMFEGMSYILHTRKCEQACMRYSEKVLPPLQAMLRAEIEQEISVKEESIRKLQAMAPWSIAEMPTKP